MLDRLRGKASQFPDMPGVYLFKDKNDRVIYVGKALSLRQRVRSYLGENEAGSPRLLSLQAKLADIDYVVTDTEVEALILECNLIKEYRPRFNINLKDDKDYPYLMITPELYPRLELLRLSQRNSRRGRYKPFSGREEQCFGPYTDVRAVRDTMLFLGTVFPLRRCRQPLDGSPSSDRPCLNYQMKRCLAPCRGSEAVPPEEYDRVVRQVILFLQGRYSELGKSLQKQMEEAAAAQKFETAAALRDRLQSLQRVAGQQQKMLTNKETADRDILALARHEGRTAVHLFRVRDGKLLSQEHFPLVGDKDVEYEEVMSSFLKNYYNRAEAVPSEVVVSVKPPEAALLEEWLRIQAGRKVKIKFPRKGSLKKLVDLARRNCFLRLQEDEQNRVRKIDRPLQELGRLLGLPGSPKRIEGYDISHLRGGETVGAMVVFREGEAFKEDYRRFNVRQSSAGDDYAALQEVIKRRIGHETWPKPNLIVIDGGRGQLSAAGEALKGSWLGEVPLVALAKNPDRLFLENSPFPVRFAANDAVLQLLQRIRDEVHRLAISGHRGRRGRRAIRSSLEDIPGVGPARRSMLLKHFGSEKKLREASIDQLQEVPGVSSSLAARIYGYLHNKQ